MLVANQTPILEAVAEDPGAEDQCPVAGLDKIRSGKLHRERARSGNDEWLPAWGVPDGSHGLQRPSMRLDEVRGHMAGCRSAHRLQHIGLELFYSLDKALRGDIFADVLDLKAGIFRLVPRRTGLANPDRDLDARVLEIECVSVPLRAIAQNSDFLSLDQTQICVLVVVDLHDPLLIVVPRGRCSA